MAARRNRRGRRRNRGRFSALYKLLSVLIIFAAILMGCVVFFRVSTVEITGGLPLYGGGDPPGIRRGAGGQPVYPQQIPDQQPYLHPAPLYRYREF